ncbi:unnamed protein product [Caenorhabditis nigoni]
MFAYSNDIDSKAILNLVKRMPNIMIDRKFVKLASVRFDVQQPEEIVYYNNRNELRSSLNKSLPDPSLSYSNSSTGSDVIFVLEKFLEKTKSPICGSRINFIVKRLPTEVNVESIIAKLRKYHIEVYFAISENTIGGNNHDALNEIAFKTNGVSIFLKDEIIDSGVVVTPHYSEDTLIYAANFNVSGQGTIELPPMIVPNEGGYGFLMSFQDDPVSDSFQSATLTCTNTIANNTFIFKDNIIKGGYEKFGVKSPDLDKGIYTMKLEYEYADQNVVRLFIRISTFVTAPPVDYWVPYDN